MVFKLPKNTKQCAQIESSFSPFLPVSWGVPQGSILGPLIFFIFINELPQIVKSRKNENDSQENVESAKSNNRNSDIIIFADDNTPTTSCKNPDELERNIQNDGDTVVNWFTKIKKVKKVVPGPLRGRGGPRK